VIRFVHVQAPGSVKATGACSTCPVAWHCYLTDPILSNKTEEAVRAVLEARPDMTANEALVQVNRARRS
jgi:hypothetical protein